MTVPASHIENFDIMIDLEVEPIGYYLEIQRVHNDTSEG